MHQAASIKDGGGGRCFGTHRKVCEHPPLGVGEGACGEVERGQRDYRVAEASHAVDQHPLHRWPDSLALCILRIRHDSIVLGPSGADKNNASIQSALIP